MGLSSPQIIKTILELKGDETPVLIHDLEWILNMLLSGVMELQGLIPWSSNYTFLVTLTKTVGLVDFLAIYKPCQGERPLWDFPDGTLCQREFASYLVSRALGWPHIPPTILRDDCPHGQGSVQFFIDSEREAHYFNMRYISTFTEDFMKVALFDYIINNADRKGGHCLRDKNKTIWAIDHGLTFHIQPKLRTVIWEFCEETIPPHLLADLERLQQLLFDEPSDLCQILKQLISKAELQAFKDRLAVLITNGHFPELKSGRNVPYPPI